MCPVAWLSLSAQLQCALQGSQPPGLLAPLAHFALNLDTRLSLLSPGRVAPGACTNLFQPDGHHAPGWPMAWGSLDVCRLGCPAWLASDRIPDLVPLHLA